MTDTAPKPGLVLLVVSTAAFLASLDTFIVTIAFPGIRAAFPGGDLATLSWVLNGYTVLFAACLAPAGRLADRYGRKRLFLAGVAVFTVASAACALAPAIPVPVAFRAVQAIGAALVMPTSLALLLSVFPPHRRPLAVGVWASVGAAAAALGPPVGGLLVEASWRWVFLVNLPICALTLLAGPRVLRESRDTASGVPDLLGAAGLLAGVGALAYALVEASDHGWGGTPVLVAFAVAAVALAWVPLRSARHAVPVSILGGRFVHRHGPGPVVALGGVAFGLGVLIWVLRRDSVPDYAGAMLPGRLLTGLGVGLILPSLSGVAGTVLPAARWGAGSAMVNTSRQIGTVLGTAVRVAVFAGTPDLADFRRGWLPILATAAAAAAGGLLIAARRRTDHHAPAAVVVRGEPGQNPVAASRSQARSRAARPSSMRSRGIAP
jgi:MFS family permease